MNKTTAEMPVLNSVSANYATTLTTAGDPDYWYNSQPGYNHCTPRRVNPFDNPPSIHDDSMGSLLEKLSDTNKDKEIEKLNRQIKHLRAEVKRLKAKQGANTVSRRLVKVIIVDPNENLTLEDAILVNEPEKFTDLDDNEIFFDMDIKKVLNAHNRKRLETVDKKASKNKEKDVFLDEIKIRDLNMSVITIATF